MRLNVIAWFYRTSPERALEVFRSSLTLAGFCGVEQFSKMTHSWDCLTLYRVKVWAAFVAGSGEYLFAKIQMCGRWDDMYPAFQRLFMDLLNQHHQLAELIGSARNPEPYPFLIPLFSKEVYSCPPTIANCDREEERIIQPGDEDYWFEYDPELHFIHQEMFDRAGANAIELGTQLNARLLPMSGGTLFDCGWTQEYEFPKQTTPWRSPP